MAEQRSSEFSVLLRFPGKPNVKITFFCAALWPKQGGKSGLYRLKIGRQTDAGAGQFSETWHPAPHRYEFLTPSAAWDMVARLTDVDPSEPPLPDIGRGTPVRVPNGNVLAGHPQYDITRTVTSPVRLSDGRVHVAVLLMGRGMVHVPLDEIQIIGGGK